MFRGGQRTVAGAGMLLALVAMLSAATSPPAATAPTAGPAAAAAARGHSTERPKASRPNVVLVLADDLGWADLPAYGNPVTRTPNIDALARAGMRFTRFYAQPVCSPSRAELQSGRHAARTGITDFIPGHQRPWEKVVTPRTALVFPDAIPTIGERLRERGYATAWFGKWHVGYAPDHATRRGYGEAWTDVAFAHVQKDGTPTAEAVATRAADFIRRHRAEPFFLVVSPTEPHVPLRARAAEIRPYEQRLRDTGATLPDPIYAALVAHLDTVLGTVTAALDDAGVRDRTLVIFASDNGGLETLDLGLGDRVTTNAPLRGEKGTVYEGGLRAPLIAAWPGRIPAGAVRDLPIGMLDLAPTFVALAGGDAPRGAFDGRSLVRVLEGGTDRARPLYFHYPHYHHGRPASAMVDGRWKLIEFLDDRSVELYDVVADIGEARNLAPRERARVRAMQARLNAWRADVHAALPTPNPGYDPTRAAAFEDPKTHQPIDLTDLRRFLGRGEYE